LTSEITQVESHRCFGGTQAVYTHLSRETRTPMTFSVYLPPQAKAGRCPVVWYLSGLTCTHANVTEKGQFQAACAELGLIFVAPDTSPRGEGVPDDPEGAWDFGLGAGFYVDATQPPWAANYRMESYVAEELPALVAEHFPADMARQAITGHSMGGHGALTLALKRPGQWRSVSAFAPIASPMRCGWGEKALLGYLGANRDAWRRYDATALMAAGARLPELLVDQGAADPFLKQLQPELLAEACAAAGVPLELRRQPGYDHSYYFVASFLAEHLRWHVERLG
jgi:S-formylglutathione hydrolase